ncbi:MAG TPA: acyl-CoA dehydrogenase family protein [Ilumatobacteraceae bacterium]|nr:acyl-CoA dehydrogenase family protein [Ilumatobacteraceae bacterium]
MTLDLEFDDVDAELAASVRRYCSDHLVDPAAAWAGGPADFWKGLAELGVLGLATPEGGGGVTTIVAVMEELGRANAPGPLVGTFLALQLVDVATRRPIADGDELVAVAAGSIVPWLPVAGTVIELDGTSAYLVRPIGDVETVETLAGEPWGSSQLERVGDLGSANIAIAVADVALAAYITANAEFLLLNAAAYAADRIQFRKPIGTFQAVAHPLADCFIKLAAARTLARIAAHAIDSEADDAGPAAAAARLSATRAALRTAFQTHQTYGAMGFTVEGPIGTRSARIRQTSLFPPGEHQSGERLLSLHGL